MTTNIRVSDLKDIPSMPTEGPKKESKGSMFCASTTNHAELHRCCSTMGQAIVAAKRLDMIVNANGIRFFAIHPNRRMMIYTWLSSSFFKEFSFYDVKNKNGNLMKNAIATLSFKEFRDFLKTIKEKNATELMLYDNVRDGTITAEPVMTKETQIRSLRRVFDSEATDQSILTFKAQHHRFELKLASSFINEQLDNWINNPWVRFSYRPKKRVLVIQGYNDLRVTTEPVIELLEEQIIYHRDTANLFQDVDDDYAIETSVSGPELRPLRHLGKLNGGLISMSWDNDTPLTVRVSLDTTGESAHLNSYVELRIQGYMKQTRDVQHLNATLSSASSSLKQSNIEHIPMSIFSSPSSALSGSEHKERAIPNKKTAGTKRSSQSITPSTSSSNPEDPRGAKRARLEEEYEEQQAEGEADVEADHQDDQESDD